MTALQIELPPKLIPVFEGPADVRGAHGGRGSGKTRSFAKMAAVVGLRFALAGVRGIILCGRQFMNSLEDSSFEEIKRAIEDDPFLSRGYEVGDRYIRTKCKRVFFAFAGLDRSIESIKSKGRILVVWVDEAQPVTREAWDTLIPTLREEGNGWNAELWITWNPKRADDEVETRFRADKNPLVKIVELNYRDNPRFPAKLERQRQADFKRDPGRAAHIWDGKYLSDSGTTFKRDWFKFYDVLPSRLHNYMASDWAGAPDEDSDREPDSTEHGVWGLSPTGDLYAVDWWDGKKDPAEWIDAWIGMVGKHKPISAFEEKGVIHRSLDSSIKKRMKETQTFTRRIALASAGSKAHRALGFAARASAGTVHLPAGKPWAMRLLNQLCDFTGEEGRTDDAVDVCSLVGRGLDHMLNAKEETPAKKVPKPGTLDFFDYLDRQKAGASAHADYYK